MCEGVKALLAKVFFKTLLHPPTFQLSPFKSQLSTPLHSSLRSINFWRVIIINLLVSSFVYMLMPLCPLMTEQKQGIPLETSGWMMLLFGLGLFIPGPFSSFLLDKYRRKDVCLWSISLLVLVSLLSMLELPVWTIAVLRFVQGISFALFHIALGSTILIDITISERRDLASFIYFWASRIALALGPAFGILALRPELWVYLKYFPVFCALVSVYLVARIDLPFRSPLEPKILSFDRCWLWHGWPLAALLLPVTFSLGVEAAANLHPMFFVALLIGFLVSLILHFAVYYRADVRAELVTGYLALIIGFTMLLVQDNEMMIRVSAGLSGYGAGCVSGRLQSFLTSVSKHTERGSAQGTYKLTFEFGLCLGFFVTCCWGGAYLTGMYTVALVMLSLALLCYLFVVHGWYLSHVRR